MEKMDSGTKKLKNHEFKQPENDTNIQEFSKKKFVPQSKRKIMWTVNLYNQWRSNRMSGDGVILFQIVNANLDLLGSFCKSDLCYALSRLGSVRK